MHRGLYNYLFPEALMYSPSGGFRQVYLILFVTAFAAMAGFGQTDVPVFLVKGRIADQNGAVIVNARVTLKADDGPAIPVTTDPTGEFTASVPENDYTLTVSADGFAKQSKQISVREANVSPVEIALAMSGIDAFVTVTSAGEYGAEVTASGTKTLTPLRDIPQSIAIVSRQQISDQSMTSIGDVVRYVPGISAHQGENNRDQVIIRGQNSTADFYINGVRDDNQYQRDLYNLERVESLKGPNALIFGRGGGGGVINRVTKEADFAPISEFTVQGGSYGNKRAAGDFGRSFGDRFAYRLNGVYENSNSYRKYVGLERIGFSPTVTFNAKGDTHFSLTYEFFRDRRTADRGITSFQGKPADVPVSTFYGNPDDSHVRANVNLISGTAEKQIGRVNVKNRTQYGDYDRFYQNYVPGAVNAAGTLVTLTAYNNATRRKNLFNQTDVTYTTSTGRIRHTLLGGVELGRQTTNNCRKTGYFNNTSTSYQTPFDDTVISVPVTFRQSATDAANHLKLNLGAVYLQDQIELTRYVQVVAGIRYDYFDLNYHNDRNGEDLRRVDKLISPRLGLVLKPFEAISVYGSYSVSFLPSSGDQFASLTTITQQLKPEKFENIEAGVKWDIRPNLSLTSAIYRLDRTNTRSTDPIDPTRIVQTGSQRTNGFEIGLSGRLTRNWAVTGGYAYQDAFITSSTTAAAAGSQVAQVPHHNFTVWNKYQVLSKLSLGLGIINRSEMFAAIDNTVKLPGYTRADAAVFYTINEEWRIQANIENLLDKKYFLNADGNTNISPGSPRALRVSLAARF